MTRPKDDKEYIAALEAAGAKLRSQMLPSGQNPETDQAMREWDRLTSRMYVTTTSGMRGFYAVLIDESDGWPEPVQTGIGSYKTSAGAASEGKQWAEAEELEFRA